MATESPDGKLAVILHADVADSTALVRRDEQLAHERIRQAFELLSTFIDQHRGRVHELRGDALLAEFERASDAVSAALAFQRQQRDRAVSDDALEAHVRIGISLGEVIVADGTITGAGVVLAQRLEQLAEPGELVVQGAVQEAIPERLPFAYTYLGEQALKGFDEPVRAYRVAAREATQSAPAIAAKPPRAGLRRLRLAGLAIVGLVAATLLAVWFMPWGSRVATTATAPPAEPQAGPPSIAVLAFTNLSDSPEQEFFADGMTDDLITDLSKVPGLMVISRTSTFAFKGESLDVREIARALDARYVVEGSVRRARDQIRINAQLIDAITGGHLWAERYDGPLEDVFALQDRITEQIVAALGQSLDAGGPAGPTTSLAAYDAFLEGSGIFQRFSRDDTFRARQYFERAIELDPSFSRAYSMLAWTYVFEYTNGWAAAADATLQRALELADKSLALDHRSPIAHFVKGLVFRERRQFDQAMTEANRAIEIEPSYANGYVLAATVLYYAGKPAEGLGMIEVASRLNPLHPSNYPFHKGQALFILERYDEAIAEFRLGLEQNPTSQRLRVWLAATYAATGRLDDAKWEAAEILTEDPDFSPVNLETIFPFQDSRDLQRFNTALNKAGFRDLSGTPAN